MELFVITTYLTAMRHRSETLAASRYVRPTEGGPMRKSNRAARARRWLGAVLTGVRLRHGDADRRPADTGGTSAAAVPSHH